MFFFITICVRCSITIHSAMESAPDRTETARKLVSWRGQWNILTVGISKSGMRINVVYYILISIFILVINKSFKTGSKLYQTFNYFNFAFEKIIIILLHHRISQYVEFTKMGIKCTFIYIHLFQLEFTIGSYYWSASFGMGVFPQTKTWNDSPGMTPLGLGQVKLPSDTLGIMSLSPD